MAQQTTPYSYTERKRIRKSFGKRESVLKVPYLLTMQRESYVAFLQKDVPPQKRKPEGLQAAFLSAFPIVSHNGFVEMKFLEFNIAKPPFDTRECQQLLFSIGHPRTLPWPLAACSTAPAIRAGLGRVSLEACLHILDEPARGAPRNMSARKHQI